MLPAPDAAALARILPGNWHLRATNLPMWLDGQRTSPGFRYEVVGEEPLALRVTAAFSTADGERKQVEGVARWAHDSFVSPGKGLRRMLSSRWSVAGTSDDGSVVVIRFEKSRLNLDGLDVLVHADSEVEELRSMIAATTERFGLTPEDFGTLSWLPRNLPR